MKKRIKVGTLSSVEALDVPHKNGTGTCRYLLDNNTAWVDLILSKTALILATVIILASVYCLAGSSSDLVKKDELEIITVDLTSNIDAAGSKRPDTGYVGTYSFNFNSERLIERQNLKISVSGEYVTCVHEGEGQNIIAVRPLSYRTIPFSPLQLRTLLSGKFAADGSITQPVSSTFPYEDVTSFLEFSSVEGLNLNVSRDVFIEKTSVFVTDGSEVNELEYVLVYQ